MSNAIPKLVHQMWIGPHPAPTEMMATWKRPGWEYQLWTEANLPELANCSLWDRAAEISPFAPEQFRSDVARYELLHAFGGVWADADMVSQKPLDPLLETEAFAGLETPQWLNNALIGAVPEHPMFIDLMSELPGNVARVPVNRGNTVKSGPQFFTPIARRFGITEHPTSYFYPYLWNELHKGRLPFPDSYAVHHWANQRKRQRRPLATA